MQIKKLKVLWISTDLSNSKNEYKNNTAEDQSKTCDNNSISISVQTCFIYLLTYIHTFSCLNYNIIDILNVQFSKYSSLHSTLIDNGFIHFAQLGKR